MFRAQKVTPLRIGKFSYFVKPNNPTLPKTRKRRLQPRTAIAMKSIIATSGPAPSRSDAPPRRRNRQILGSSSVAAAPGAHQVTRIEFKAVPPYFPKFLTALGKGTTEVWTMYPRTAHIARTVPSPEPVRWVLRPAPTVSTGAGKHHGPDFFILNASVLFFF